MRTTFLLLLTAALPAHAGFLRTTQPVPLEYGQKNVTVTFRADCPITRAKPLCDCTKVSFKGDTLTAFVDVSQFDGPVDKQIEATTADGKTVKLTMFLEVPVAVDFSAHSLVWKKGEAPTPQTLRITIPKGSPVSGLTEAGLNGKAFDFQTKSIKPGQEYSVEVTPLSTAKPVLNRLVIKTKSTDIRSSQYIIYLQVKK